ncbi:hypothetical protein EDM02_03750 [Candidatus Cardinium hertigii]|uniref:Uncharacterized protein n=1 Tax=Candidatus Cardinium hertigii TaxID=247481 RepID=A0A3N2QBW1_9BACT|nr:hypothetical protein EDM02_03750 [Candidatus Cardinium hertigii]
MKKLWKEKKGKNKRKSACLSLLFVFEKLAMLYPTRYIIWWGPLFRFGIQRTWGPQMYAYTSWGELT